MSSSQARKPTPAKEPAVHRPKKQPLVRMTAYQLLIRLLAITAVSILVSQTLVMVIGLLSPPFSAWRKVLFDSAPLILLLSLLLHMIERRRAEEALHKRERRFADIAENALEWIWEVDANGRYTYSSPVVEQILGYKPEEVLERHFYDLFHPEDREELKKAAFQVFAVKQPLREFVSRNLHKNGETVWLSTSGVAMLDEKGNLLGYRGADTDITDHKRADEALEERLKVESAVAETSSLLVRAQSVDAGMNGALETLRKAVGVDRCYVFVARDPNASTVNIDEWCAPASEPELNGLRGLDYAAFPWWMEKLRQDEAIVVPDVSRMPPEAGREKEILEAQDVRSLLVVPLNVGGELAGLMGFDDTEGPRSWREEDITILRLASETISSFVARKRAEEALRNSEAKYRHIFENVQDIYYRTDEKGIITEISPVAEKYGYIRDELIGTQVLDIYEDPEQRSELLKVLLERGEVVDYEVRLRTGDGGVRDTSVSAHILRDAEGTLVGVEGTLRDISERKLAEVQLTRQTAVLNAVNLLLRETLTSETEEEVARTCLNVAEELTSSRFGFVGEVNENGRLDTIALSDPGWDACPIRSSDAVTMLQNMEIRGVWAGAVKDERSLIVNDPSSHPDRVGTPEGHPPITRFLGVPLKHGGKTIGMIGLANKESAYDLTDQEAVESLSAAFVEALMRKRAQDALRESEERYRELFENANDMVYTHDLEGRFTSVNRAAEQVTGYTREEAYANNFATILVPEYLSVTREAILRKLRGEPSTTYEVEIITKDGRRVPLEISTRLIHKDGKPVGVQGIARDISERKRIERLLVQQAEREKELHQRQSEFVATASHELRTPLHSIRGFARLLLDGRVDKPETLREFLTIIDDQSELLTALVNDLLDVAKIEAGRMEMRKEPLSLHDLVTNTAVEFGPTAEEKALTIEADLPTDLPTIEGDREQLGRVLTNLVGNAIKFSDVPGEITIAARADGPEVVVSVQDQGIGIPEEALPHLFERFYQVDSSSTRERGGTGLGLHISKQIVEAHGGRIWVESKVGEGSTFSFAIPASVSGSKDTRTTKAA
jgi:PAS domain S-box-containing protein